MQQQHAHWHASAGDRSWHILDLCDDIFAGVLCLQKEELVLKF
jgi:hypothetical protein